MIEHLHKVGKQPGGSMTHKLAIWGKGAMIYCNIKCDRNGVVIGRYLPIMGSPPLPIDTSRSVMWHAKDEKNEMVDPRMLSQWGTVMKRMWSECLKCKGSKS